LSRLTSSTAATSCGSARTSRSRLSGGLLRKGWRHTSRTGSPRPQQDESSACSNAGLDARSASEGMKSASRLLEALVGYAVRSWPAWMPSDLLPCLQEIRRAFRRAAGGPRAMAPLPHTCALAAMGLLSAWQEVAWFDSDTAAWTCIAPIFSAATARRTDPRGRPATPGLGERPGVLIDTPRTPSIHDAHIDRIDTSKRSTRQARCLSLPPAWPSASLCGRG
jgi:hypothetical protein